MNNDDLRRLAYLIDSHLSLVSDLEKEMNKLCEKEFNCHPRYILNLEKEFNISASKLSNHFLLLRSQINKED